MIPKVIHYCWFGHGEKPEFAQKCIASWRKYCPDYEIIEWNENNFDINMNPYTKKCYEEKKYAFVSDYARLLIVEQNGGFYFDTDVEVVRSIDALRNHGGFIGFENNSFVNTGQGFGAQAHNPAVKAMLLEYDEMLNGAGETIGCPILNTRALVKLGLALDGNYQELTDITVYPAEYFNPYDAPAGLLFSNDRTYSIHWYAKSWMKKSIVIRSRLMRPIHRMKRRMKERKGKQK